MRHSRRGHDGKWKNYQSSTRTVNENAVDPPRGRGSAGGSQRKEDTWASRKGIWKKKDKIGVATGHRTCGRLPEQKENESKASWRETGGSLFWDVVALWTGKACSNPYELGTWRLMYEKTYKSFGLFVVWKSFVKYISQNMFWFTVKEGLAVLSTLLSVLYEQVFKCHVTLRLPLPL